MCSLREKERRGERQIKIVREENRKIKWRIRRQNSQEEKTQKARRKAIRVCLPFRWTSRVTVPLVTSQHPRGVCPAEGIGHVCNRHTAHTYHAQCALEKKPYGHEFTCPCPPCLQEPTGSLTAGGGAPFWLLSVKSWLLSIFCGERKPVISVPLAMKARLPCRYLTRSLVTFSERSEH